MPTEKQLRNQEILRVITADDLIAYQALTKDEKLRLVEIAPLGTHLHIAADAGSFKIVKYLVEQGVDVNRRAGTIGGNALNEAAPKGHLRILKYLLDAGSEMDTSEPERNPLFSAIYGGNEDGVRILIDAGIDATIKYTGESMKDMDAYAFAIERGQLKIADLIHRSFNSS